MRQSDQNNINLYRVTKTTLSNNSYLKIEVLDNVGFRAGFTLCSHYENQHCLYSRWGKGIPGQESSSQNLKLVGQREQPRPKQKWI